MMRHCFSRVHSTGLEQVLVWSVGPVVGPFITHRLLRSFFKAVFAPLPCPLFSKLCALMSAQCVAIETHDILDLSTVDVLHTFGILKMSLMTHSNVSILD